MAAPKKAKGLGKGLDALFGDVEVTPVKSADKKESSKQAKADTAAKKSDETEASQGGVLYIDINDIKPNTGQPRKHFDEEKLEELASSIQQHGLIQPIVLRKLKTGYEIVAGERRWRACKLAGLEEIPVIVREDDERKNNEYAIGIEKQ